MKAIITLILPALMLIGCGQMKTNETSANNMLSEMNSNGSISFDDANSVDESLLDETVAVAETSSDSIIMKLGGAELFIDFIENLSGEPEEVAMIINGVEVATKFVADPASFQGLIASLVTAQLEKVDILGIPAKDLVQVGLQLVKGDGKTASFSNLFGTLVRGALNMYLSKTPFGSLVSEVANSLGKKDPLSSAKPGDSTNVDPNNQNSNQNSGKVKETVVNAIGGALSAANPLLGGIFSLIANLIK